MVSIELINLHWLFSEHPEQDLCAHGGVRICTDGFVFLDESSSKWTVSAAALYLLRTLTKDHTKKSPVCEHLFPCCGFWMIDNGETEDVYVFGCPNGVDFEIQHFDEFVIIKNEAGIIIQVKELEWRNAVYHFADAVEDFYHNSAPKQPFDQESSNGYKAFWREWQHRRLPLPKTGIFPNQ